MTPYFCIIFYNYELFLLYFDARTTCYIHFFNYYFVHEERCMFVGIVLLFIEYLKLSIRKLEDNNDTYTRCWEMVLLEWTNNLSWNNIFIIFIINYLWDYLLQCSTIIRKIFKYTMFCGEHFIIFTNFRHRQFLFQMTIHKKLNSYKTTYYKRVSNH